MDIAKLASKVTADRNAFRLIQEVATGVRIFAHHDTQFGWSLLSKLKLVTRADGAERAELTELGREVHNTMFATKEISK